MLNECAGEQYSWEGGKGAQAGASLLERAPSVGVFNAVTQRRGLAGSILATQQGSISRKRMQQVPSQDLQCEFLGSNREQEVKALEIIYEESQGASS